MRRLLEKLLIILLSATLLSGYDSFYEPVIAVLSVIAVSSLIQAAENRILKIILVAIYISACFINNGLAIFLPLVIYDIFENELYYFLIPATASVIIRYSCGLSIRSSLGILLLSVTAAFLEKMNRSNSKLEHDLKETRDNAVERSNELQDKNRSLIEAQDNEIHLATLKERNRIAREIHDNVGHMLTRTILQMGALKILNKDENLDESITSIKDTLDEAMTSIRKSVHDLHDDSIDLEGALNEAIEPLRERFSVSFEYDVSNLIDRSVKYCFIALVKEGVNNIIKHSNGSHAAITVREHPGMYTLLIQDDGKCPDKIGSSGIGLENMRERVQALDGNINITSGSDGFKILVSIIKK